MSPNHLSPYIRSVTIAPNPVNAGSTFRIAVEVESCDHAWLSQFTHQELGGYKHFELCTPFNADASANVWRSQFTHDELHDYTHIQLSTEKIST